MQAIDADKSSVVVYSIRSGNEKQLFNIDKSSGEILISSPNGLQKSKDVNITLVVVVRISIFICSLDHCFKFRFFFLGK